MIKLEMHNQAIYLGPSHAASTSSVSRHRAAPRARPAPSDLEDGAGFFRGLLIGLALTVPFWAMLGWCAWRLLGL